MAFKCTLVTPNASLFDNEIWQITVNGNEGIFSIRTGHAPIIASLNKGYIEIALTEKDRRKFEVTSGILEHKNNICTVLCEKAVLKE